MSGQAVLQALCHNYIKNRAAAFRSNPLQLFRIAYFMKDCLFTLQQYPTHHTKENGGIQYGKNLLPNPHLF